MTADVTELAALTTAFARTDGPDGTAGMVASAHRRATEAGVEILYHTQVADVVASRGHIDSVIVSNKAGLVAYSAKDSDRLYRRRRRGGLGGRTFR